MAEKIKARLLVVGVDFTDNKDIIDKATAIAAVWKAQPLTLRDDELIIQEEAPEEDEVFSHELDPAVDYGITGSSITVTGSMIMPTVDQLIELFGGTKDGTAFLKGTTKLLIEKAIRFRFQGGGWVVLTRAKGYVTWNMNVGRGGRVKFPFSFKALAPQEGGADLIWETEDTVAAPAALAAPLAATVSVPVTEKETKK